MSIELVDIQLFHRPIFQVHVSYRICILPVLAKFRRRKSTTMQALLLPSLVLSAQALPLRALGPLPSLNIVGQITISGISSGADMAAQMLVAASDIVSGAGIFAGQPPSCAVQNFVGEPTMTCASQPDGTKGPGCVGLNDTGIAPCIGCPAGMTVTYDHCKGPLVPFIQVR